MRTLQEAADTALRWLQDHGWADARAASSPWVDLEATGLIALIGATGQLPGGHDLHRLSEMAEAESCIAVAFALGGGWHSAQHDPWGVALFDMDFSGAILPHSPAARQMVWGDSPTGSLTVRRQPRDVPGDEPMMGELDKLLRFGLRLTFGRDFRALSVVLDGDPPQIATAIHNSGADFGLAAITSTRLLWTQPLGFGEPTEVYECPLTSIRGVTYEWTTHWVRLLAFTVDDVPCGFSLTKGKRGDADRFFERLKAVSGTGDTKGLDGP